MCKISMSCLLTFCFRCECSRLLCSQNTYTIGYLVFCTQLSFKLKYPIGLDSRIWDAISHTKTYPHQTNIIIVGIIHSCSCSNSEIQTHSKTHIYHHVTYKTPTNTQTALSNNICILFILRKRRKNQQPHIIIVDMQSHSYSV